jgi:hypothetical protein
MIYETPNLLERCREYPMNGVIGKKPRFRRKTDAKKT